MLVDPTGKVQIELDEKEGIAFGEVGKYGCIETGRKLKKDFTH